jgi:hypothetical protein
MGLTVWTGGRLEEVGRELFVGVACASAIGIMALLLSGWGAAAHGVRRADWRGGVWIAGHDTRASLVPLLAAGEAGWCLRVVTETTNREGLRGGGESWCGKPKISSGPIFAEECTDGIHEAGTDGIHEAGLAVVLTKADVSSVSIGGGAHVPTVVDPMLPGGLRVAYLQALEYEPRGAFMKRCPAVTAFDATGKELPAQVTPSAPLAVRLPHRAWWRPQAPSAGVCGLTATKLRLGTVAWSGAVATEFGPVPQLPGRSLLSCASTEYIHSEGHYVTVAVLLNASRPGAPPPPLPGIKPLTGYPGIFDAPDAGPSGQRLIVARRIPHAWLVATEETPYGLAVPVEMLHHMRITIKL